MLIGKLVLRAVLRVVDLLACKLVLRAIFFFFFFFFLGGGGIVLLIGKFILKDRNKINGHQL